MSHEPGIDVEAAAARRSRLVGLKLRALVRDHLSDETVGEALGFAPGAALVHGGEAWVFLDDHPARRLGAALAWMMRSGVSALHVIAESGSGVLARRAPEFTTPITVWHAEGRTLWPAVAEPFVPESGPPPEHMQLCDLIAAGGAEPAVEHGVLAGEVRGLEVCRVVDDNVTGEPRLDVGIGANDRDAFAMLHGAVPAVDSLARVVAVVEEQRRVGAAPHPFNRLAAERLLRWRLIDEPTLIGASALRPMSPPVPRANLKDPVPCVASGVDAEGGSIVVVCSVGVDLDLIPFAADARLAAESAPGYKETTPRLVVVTPARDLVKVTSEIAGLLRDACELVSID